MTFIRPALRSNCMFCDLWFVFRYFVFVLINLYIKIVLCILRGAAFWRKQAHFSSVAAAVAIEFVTERQHRGVIAIGYAVVVLLTGTCQPRRWWSAVSSAFTDTAEFARPRLYRFARHRPWPAGSNFAQTPLCNASESAKGVKVSRNAPERRSGARKFKSEAFRL